MDIRKISSGVCMRRKSPSIPATLTVVIMTVAATDRIAAIPTLFFMASISPAPKRCEVSTVKPAVNPVINPRIKNMIVPVAPTAASA